MRSTVSYRKVYCSHVFLYLLVIITQKIHTQAKAECPSYGCPLTAVDILYDESTKEALSILRQTETKSSNNDDDKSNGEQSNGENHNNVLRNQALSTLELAGGGSKTTMTLRGYKGGKLEDQINQDRAMVVSPLNILPNSSTPVPTAQLLGVFDGHGGGGELTSQYAVERVPSLLAAKLASIFFDDDDIEIRQQENNNVDNDSAVIEALKQTFDEVDKNDPSHGNAGCTATVVLRLGQKLFIANSGDR